MTAADPITSVPLHASTLRLLQEFKTGAQNWDEFLIDLIESEMDREDTEFAQELIKEYRAGRVKAVARARKK